MEIINDLENLEKEIDAFIRLRVKQSQNRCLSLYAEIRRLVYSKREKNEKIWIGVIHGTDSQVLPDFVGAFLENVAPYGEGGKGYIGLKFCEVQLSDDEALSKEIRNLRNKEKVDLIVIIRGGGDQEKLKSIGGKKTIRSILDVETPVCLAIGHSLDKMITLIEKVCLFNFPVPAIAGSELGVAFHTFFYKYENEFNKTHNNYLSNQTTTSYQIDYQIDFSQTITSQLKKINEIAEALLNKTEKLEKALKTIKTMKENNKFYQIINLINLLLLCLLFVFFVFKLRT